MTTAINFPVEDAGSRKRARPEPGSSAELLIYWIQSSESLSSPWPTMYKSFPFWGLATCEGERGREVCLPSGFWCLALSISDEMDMKIFGLAHHLPQSSRPVRLSLCGFREPREKSGAWVCRQFGWQGPSPIINFREWKLTSCSWMVVEQRLENPSLMTF